MFLRNNTSVCRSLLERWIPYARGHLHAHPENSGLLSFGTGHSGNWSMQATTTAAGAYAALAMDPDTDTAVTGMSRDALLASALGLVRFWYGTHISGEYHGTDGESWGHTWISALCTERLLHTLQVLDAELTHEDRAAVARLHAGEADWLLNHHPVTCGLRENNRPESNLWNGALMHRAAILNPDHPDAPRWHDRGIDFLVNSISIPADGESGRDVAGRSLSERHAGPNCTPDFEMFHHNYLNVGYMAICLSNIAMAHFWLKRAGHTVPEALYHHAGELWHLVKGCTFPDGRLCRIGGDTRVRYTYCQDYALAAWHWAADFLDDGDVNAFQQGWLKQVAVDMDAAGDGSCLGERLNDLAAASPLYRLRLEGDRAGSLSMAMAWNAIAPAESEPPPAGEAPFAWHGRESGSVLVRGPRRLASFVWNGAAGPTGLVLPGPRSDWAEWSGSLAGHVRGMGTHAEYPWTVEESRLTGNGFFTRGHYVVRETRFVSEGDADRDVARVEAAVTALDDGSAVLVAQRAVALIRDDFACVKGLYYQLPNDIFNGDRRVLYCPAGAQVLQRGDPDLPRTAVQGQWVNIDGALGIVALAGGPLLLHRPRGRTVAVRRAPRQDHAEATGAGHLRCEEICQGVCLAEPRLFDKGAVLFDTLTLLQTGVTSEQTQAAVNTAACRDLNALSAAAWSGTLTRW